MLFIIIELVKMIGNIYAFYIVLLQGGVFEGAVHLEELNILLGHRYSFIPLANG